VVEDGTATRASLATFTVAGKTGTSRRSVGGGYESGAYTSTFAGYFPANDPQIVILVKLDEPQGVYYGGLTAAPVTREMLQGILAARTPALSPRTLLASRTALVAVARSTDAVDRDPPPSSGGRYVFLLSEDLPHAGTAVAPRPVPVPDLAGLSMREATRRAHASGLRARVSGSGEVVRTDPEAGGTVVRGQVLTLVGGERR
jgi:cell division protein FtsI (penicillin-binding protein 3)